MTSKEKLLGIIDITNQGNLYEEDTKMVVDAIKSALQDLEVLEILKKGLENAGYIKIFYFNADKLEIHEIMKVRNWLNGKD